MPDKTPLTKDMVTLDDSDEELVTDSSSDSEFELDLDYSKLDKDASSNDRVKDIVESIMDKLEIKNQIDQSVDVLQKRFDRNDESMKEIDQMFAETEKSLDTLRENLYKGFRPKLKHLGSVDLNDDSSVSSFQVADFLIFFLRASNNFFLLEKRSCQQQSPA